MNAKIERMLAIAVDHGHVEARPLPPQGLSPVCGIVIEIEWTDLAGRRGFATVYCFSFRDLRLALGY